MKYQLENGVRLPEIAFGTWKLPAQEETTQIIQDAIEVGYRYFDTAKSYGNETYMGKGIKASKINRKDVIIAGKLWNDDRNRVMEACEETIHRLDCDYLDVYLMHWPASKAVHEDWKEINVKVWKDMEKLLEMGMVKTIGVCNFKVNQLEDLLAKISIKPMINQIEFHPGFMQKEIVDYCKCQKILVEAWSPLGSGKMLKKEELKQIANKYQKDVAKICIKWCLQNQVLPIPKSEDKERMKSNLEVSDFEITKEDMEYLNQLPYLGGSGLDSETLTLFG